MNIFYLHHDPLICAKMHCDKHVVKMILEYSQILSTAHHECDGVPSVDCYKATHKNHPSTVWARENFFNYDWLHALLSHLSKEYTHRYGKHHATERLNIGLSNVPQNIPNVEFTDPPQCMPDYCKGEDTVLAYQNYYILEKANFAKWTKRSVPLFFVEKNDGEGAVLGLHGPQAA